MAVFHSADSVLSAQRNFMFSKVDKINLARNSKRLAGAVLESLWQTHEMQNPLELESAFRYIEKSKNLVLLQSISVNQGKGFAGIPDSVLRREEKVLGTIHFFNHQIEMEKDSVQKAELQGKLFEHLQAHKELVEYLEKEFPEYYHLKYNEEVPTIADVQDHLDDETVVLSYFTGSNVVYRYAITKNNFSLVKLPVENFDDLLTGMRKGIMYRLNGIYIEKARQLYRLLIPDNIPKEAGNLVIIPDGNLSLLPFEALLQNDEDGNSSPGRWSYLLNRFNISYSPSFALWLKLRQPSPPALIKNSMLAFAPVFTRETESGLTSIEPDHGPYFSAYNLSLNDFGLAPLKESENEVTEVCGLFQNNSSKSGLYLFSEASEKNFCLQPLDQFNFIHIATHGFVNKINPELSGLLFAPVQDSGYDNILYTGEIYNLKLNADLVTLSACDTGMGKIAEGEGLLGFSRAFLYSGAKNLMLSLWKVNDVSTSELMVDFYSGVLDRNEPFAASLATAKKDLIKAGFSHPFYWAPFILIGE